MKRPTLAILMFPLALTFFMGCKECKSFNTTTTDIVRVFMHEPNRFSFLINNHASPELYIKTYLVSQVKFISDVPPEQKMWALHRNVCTGDSKINGCPELQLEIHIHDEKNIDGAGWNHGKFGSGNTQIVE